MKHDAFAAIRIREFQSFLGFRLFLTFATQMQAVIVGWQVYEITKDPLSLGMLGLAEVVPYVATALFGGYVADRFDRRKIALLCTAIFTLCSAALLAITYYDFGAMQHVEYFFYAIIFVTGIARGFLAPSISAMFAQVVPRALYLNASAWTSNLWHVAAVSGPAIGGVVYGFFGVHVAYISLIAVSLAAMIFMWFLPTFAPHHAPEDETVFQSIAQGVSFVFNNQVILGALMLDMVAVLFGGVVAILPVFASDVLQSGPEGLGYLRAAPFVGSVIMGVYLTVQRPMKRAGWALLVSVGAFGVTMIFFALSTSMWVSLVMLFLSGVFDSVSVVIRSAILQLMMPDHMRGRVSAVNNIFVGTSNELGAFESGLAARLFGLVPSIILGGSISIAAVIMTGLAAPKLRKLDLRTLSHTPHASSS